MVDEVSGAQLKPPTTEGIRGPARLDVPERPGHKVLIDTPGYRLETRENVKLSSLQQAKWELAFWETSVLKIQLAAYRNRGRNSIRRDIRTSNTRKDRSY